MMGKFVRPTFRPAHLDSFPFSVRWTLRPNPFARPVRSSNACTRPLVGRVRPSDPSDRPRAPTQAFELLLENQVDKHLTQTVDFQ